MARKPKVEKPKPLFTRNEVVGLCRRFLKEDEFGQRYYDPVMSPITMYKLLKQFPHREFWLHYELGFTLRSLFWFTGPAGQERLNRDWGIFNLDLGTQVIETVGDTKVGEDLIVEKPKLTVADLLR